MYAIIPSIRIINQIIHIQYVLNHNRKRGFISRLRVVTSDENLIVKDEVKPAVLVEKKVDDEDGDGVPKRLDYPVDCLPVSVRNFVIDTARVIGLSDLSSVTTVALAVLAGVIGASCRVVIKKGHNEPAGLFTAIVADSGVACPSLGGQNFPDYNVRRKVNCYARQIEIENGQEISERVSR